MTVDGPTHDEPARDRPPAHAATILVLVCAAQFLCVLDDTIVTIALPSVQADLGFTGSGLAWVVNGYLLTFGGLLLLGGRATDVLPRRNVFLTGTVAFGIASLACGLATTPALLVAARIAQGAGAAFMSAAALAILSTTFTGAARARAFGVWGGLSGAAGTLGVLIGGVLTTGLSWRWIFVINVPVVVAVVVLGLRVLPPGRPARRAALDPLGAVTGTAGLALILVGAGRAGEVGWGSPVTLGFLVGGAAMLALFVAVEARHRSPLVPLRVFRLPGVSGGLLCQLALSGAMLGAFVSLSLHLQQVLGWSAWSAGLAFLPISGGVILAAAVTSGVVNRYGPVWPLTTGFALIAVGLEWLATIGPDGRFVTDVLGPTVVLGLGLGASLVSVVVAATRDLAGEDGSGLASGLVNTANQVGDALGVAVLTAVATAGGVTSAALAVGVPHGLHVAAGVAVAGLLVAVLVLPRTTSVDCAARPDADPLPRTGSRTRMPD